MSFTTVVISLAGAIALLLWGMRMVQTGVQRAFGPRLRILLGRALNNRVKALLAGLGVTAALQSSTATGLMVAGFAAGGVVELVPALAVMLGANLGTTLVVQVLSFDIALLSPLLILLGFLMFRRDPASVVHDLGRSAIGLGLMLLALHQLMAVMAPLESAPALRELLRIISTVPLLDVLLAAALTWATHSSVAVVLLIMSLAQHGIVPPETALALVLGANLGSAVNPVVEGGGRDDPAARRVPLGNLLNRLVGLALALPLLPWIAGWLTVGAGEPGLAVVWFHVGFNLVLALLFLPLLSPYARLLRRWLPDRPAAADPGRPLYLDEATRRVPGLALGAAAREALRLADLLEELLAAAQQTLGARRAPPGCKALEEALGRLAGAIRAYLAALDTESLDEADHRRMREIITFVTQLDQAGGVARRILLPHAAALWKEGPSAESGGIGDLRALLVRLRANLRTAAALFMTEDPRAAHLLAEEKTVFRQMESAATRVYLDRLRHGAEAADAGALRLDLLRDIKRINSHLVAAAAYPVLERAGALLPSRVAGKGA
ncbi:Na/Pi cotransporter family protein [Roseomonas marmotae]|uniref:Na/Pi cotransporter family protein n=1 Tax=Roseomonas marmotae TaxID=2768161 RepID=A0ABS3K821_9PROT|nr:Na/Pi cotransporter family protein [Roseomonas marmotae]MBO1073621.1 Na/Pi cotransporter family protein [Roseomonas marmotae]MBO1073651.1 Na/Pi cotransporter family protein [Roseomonas marmotae]QTI80199.1 Na/Pi cotransporter family protein [Roseomonas marmotae]